MHNPKVNRSGGFLWPGRYTKGNNLFLTGNTFFSVEDPTVIEDNSSSCPASCNCPPPQNPPCFCIEPNFFPNEWGGVQTNPEFITRKNDACYIWDVYLNSPVQYDPNVTYSFNPPPKSFFTFRTTFANQPNFCCCNGF
jgi:hypothetical protein